MTPSKNLLRLLRLGSGVALASALACEQSQQPQLPVLDGAVATGAPVPAALDAGEVLPAASTTGPGGAVEIQLPPIPIRAHGPKERFACVACGRG